ncbi:hypothetical protein B484DRAFT_428238, partial [Ochromonadaceae sp. CCMP2298]
VDWPTEYEVIMPIAQMLFDSDLPGYLLGSDMHANGDYGPGLENLMRCTYTSNFSYARDNCGHLDYADAGNFHEGLVVQVQSHVCIDIVLRTSDTVVTFGIDKGQATFRSTGDTHGNRYREFKFVVSDVAISGSDTFTLEFYPQQKFMIRTPLNTVNMGLTLFGLELDTMREAVVQMVGGQGQGQSGAPSALEVVQKLLLGKIDELKTIARDVTASTDEAVVVLDDLLNYDKVILMDFEMPVLNGPSATRLLREQGCRVHIIGVTGNVMRADIDYFKSCGADAVFAKPLNKDSVDKLMVRISTPRAEGRSDS